MQPGRGHGDRRWRPQGHTRFTLAAPGARPGNDPIGDDRVKATLRQHRSQKRQSDKPAHVSWRCDSAGLWATQWDAQCDGLRMVVCVDGGGHSMPRGRTVELRFAPSPILASDTPLQHSLRETSACQATAWKGEASTAAQGSGTHQQTTPGIGVHPPEEQLARLFCM